MKAQARHEALYLANAALLFTHEIDAGYWHEWELLGVPGGIQVFLLLNLALIAGVLYGFRQVVRGHYEGRWFAALLATLGVFAFLLHAAFLLAGDAAFRLPVSLLLVVLALAVSLVQGALTARTWRAWGRDA